ncbi:MAG TPA: hypothetical protein VF005_04190 [Acidimicrobiales bacterium]
MASFADPDSNDAATAAASSYTAKIAWGDGTATDTSATISGNDANFTVSGTHTYLEEGTYHPLVTITDSDLPSVTTSATSTANVSDANLQSLPKSNSFSYLSGHPVLLWPNPPGTGTLASFTDADPNGALSDFSATINWGDGSSSAGTITTNAGGGWDVSGSHVYATLGEFPASVVISDAGGSKTTANVPILTYAFSAGGNFAIGGKDVPPGHTGPVNYWGSSWWQQNAPTSGSAPASFKGFINTPSTSQCGGWTTSTGNSPPPPATVPAYMSTIAVRSVNQTGSTISGTTGALVVVRTDPGYAPNPGHPGSGTVVAIIASCP